MSHFYRSEIYGSHLGLLIVLLGAMSLFTDCGNITWLEPPPFETVTDASMISRTNKQVIQGSLNEELSCNFSLTLGLAIAVVAMKFRSRPAVTFVPNVFLRVEPYFAKRFNAVWVPNRLTLILFNVTDAEEGEYCCQVVTIGRSPRTWIRKIQLLVVDPSQAMAPSTTVPQNLIQTTVSTITASEDKRQTTISFLSNDDSIQTTDYSITASEVDNPGAIIGAVIGVIAFCLIAIPTVCFWKWGKCSKKQEVHHVAEEGKDSEERDLSQVQSGYAQSGPPAASGPKGQPSAMNKILWKQYSITTL